MSSHDNHDNHSNEPKAVSFTVPFILASVTLVLIFLFFVSISYLNKTIHQKKSQLNESALISK